MADTIATRLQPGPPSKRLRTTVQGALVTGAASGIGLATAKLLAARGCCVLFADRDEENGRAAAKAAGQLFQHVDVSDEASVKALIAHAEKVLPNLAQLVNCAGCDFSSEFGTYPSSQFDRAIQVNLKSIFLMCREALPLLKASRGSVVNVASIQAYRCFTGFSAYSATKGAIISMSRQLAGDLARFGVRVNSVSPGDVRTNLGRNSHKFEGQEAEPEPVKREGNEDALLETLEPEAVGEAIVAMLSLRGVTGQDLIVDGGCSIVGVPSWQPFPTKEDYPHTRLSSEKS